MKMKPKKNDFIKALAGLKVKKQVVEAITSLDREAFFDPTFRDRVYSLEQIPIGLGQKSEDPIILAKMIDRFYPHKNWKVLEVGSGSGFSTAALASLVKEVVTVEFHEELALSAKEKVISNGHRNVRFFSGDATDLGEKLGSFDGIIIYAACTQTPFSLVSLLKTNGAAVFPMGPPHQQQITRFVNAPCEGLDIKNFKFFDFCFFDSIKGKYGWTEK
jgi:protein-L-isoaspartate(D-aspartate) O-methyltransferase